MNLVEDTVIIIRWPVLYVVAHSHVNESGTQLFALYSTGIQWNLSMGVAN